MSAQNTKNANMGFLESAKEGDCDGIQYSLDEEGADINATDSAGKTALHISIEKQKKDCIRILLDKGADVHIADDKGNTPLHLASIHSYYDAAELLLIKGAKSDVDKKNKNGQTPLDLANWDLLKELYLQYRPNLKVVKNKNTLIRNQIGKLQKNIRNNTRRLSNLSISNLAKERIRSSIQNKQRNVEQLQVMRQSAGKRKAKKTRKMRKTRRT